jgi:methylase of polypeptide subunit release factors
VAEKNAKSILDEQRLQKIEFINADILPSSDKEDFIKKYESGINIIVSNPPYITTDNYEKLPKEVKDFEPREALHAGDSGLEVYGAIIDSVLPFVNMQFCAILFETDPYISASLKKLVEKKLSTTKFKTKDISIKKDYNKRDRVLKAVLSNL